MLKEKRFALAAASIIAYGGVSAIVLTLTVSSLVVPIVINQDWQWFAGIMSVVYTVVLFSVVASYKATFDITIEKMNEWAKSAHEAFPGQFKTTGAGYEEWG